MQFKLLVLLKSHKFILKSRFKLKSSSKLSVWRKNVSAVIQKKKLLQKNPVKGVLRKESILELGVNFWARFRVIGFHSLDFFSTDQGQAPIFFRGSRPIQKSFSFPGFLKKKSFTKRNSRGQFYGLAILAVEASSAIMQFSLNKISTIGQCA